MARTATPARPATQSSRRWTIGINLLWLVPGNVGGTEEYAMRLLRSLPRAMDERAIASEVELVIFATPAVAATYPWLSDVGRVEVCRDLADSRARRVLVEATWLRRRSRGCSFVHHLGGTIPVSGKTPTLLTVHDLQPFDRPDTFGQGKRAWLQRRLPTSIAESTVVMTPTQWVADQIIERFGTPPSRLSVVPSSFDAPAAASDATSQLLKRKEIGLSESYVLYPAITYLHKNHQVLIEALALTDSDTHLVLTGRADVAEPTIERLVRDLGLDARVHRLGRVEADEFAAVLAGASGLVFPSLYEGFGLPIIEAMAADIPVIAADIPVLREVGGGAARFVDATAPAMWAAAIDDLGDSLATKEMIEAGAKRAQVFRPSESAKRLVEVYAGVLGLDASASDK